MNPNEDEDYSFDERNDADPVMWELRIEMLRLQAQIDQLAASARERATEIAELRVQLTKLELRVNTLKMRHRRHMQLWVWMAALYGAVAGIGLSYLIRP
jgi:hypothetical protein